MVEDIDMAIIEEWELEHLLDNYLDMSIGQFHNCENDLTLISDNVTNELHFASELTKIEMTILAYGMMLPWLEAKIRRDENLRQYIGTKEFNKLSTANTLFRLNDMQERTENKVKELKRTYRQKDLTGLN